MTFARPETTNGNVPDSGNARGNGDVRGNAERRENAGGHVASGDRPVYFASGDEVLFGVHTPPAAGRDLRAGILCLHSGGYVNSAHANQMWVRVAQGAAQQGLHCLRFDPTGSGDSSGTSTSAIPDWQSVLDVVKAAAWLQKRGAERIYLVGTCRGALQSAAAARQVQGMAGMCLGTVSLTRMWAAPSNGLQHWQAPTIRAALASALQIRVLRRLATDPEYLRWVLERARKRLSYSASRARRGPSEPTTGNAGMPDALEALRWSVEQGLPVKVVFGSLDEAFLEFDAARETEIPSLLYGAANVEIDVFEGRVHGFQTIDAEDRFVGAVESWLAGVCQPLDGRQDARTAPSP